MVQPLQGDVIIRQNCSYVCNVCAMLTVDSLIESVSHTTLDFHSKKSAIVVLHKFTTSRTATTPTQESNQRSPKTCSH